MRIPIVTVLLLAATLMLAPAQAQQADLTLTLEADDADGCLDQQALDCFRIADGSLDTLQTGMLVHITLQNVGDNPHNVYVTPQSSADTDTRDTNPDDAINGSETIDPGEETTLVFTVPDDAEGLYLWCEVGTHEAFGMYLTADIEQAPDGDDDPDDGADQEPDDGETPEGDSDEAQSVPAPTLAPVLALIMALAATTNPARSSFEDQDPGKLR